MAEQETSEATHCISCGNELSDHEDYIGVGHCLQCLEEACEYYWKQSRKEFRNEK